MSLQPLTQTMKILMHKDEMFKLRDINNSADLRTPLYLELSRCFAEDAIFFFIIEGRQRCAKCCTRASFRSSEGERGKRKNKVS